VDPSVLSNVDPSTFYPLIMGLSIACLGVPLAVASAVASAPAALVGGYVCLGLGVYGTVLTAPLLPFLLPLVLVPLVPVGCGQIPPFQWRY